MPKIIGAPAAPPRSGRFINAAAHPVLLKLLKHQAIDLDSSITEILHEMLCERFHRPDLLIEVPLQSRMTAEAT